MEAKRIIFPVFREAMQESPIVTLLGARQVGKTTLCKQVYPSKPYVSLEEPDERRFCEKDPRAFLGRYPSGAILDEVQRVPELLSYLQSLVDENRQPGQFVLTGSHQPKLREAISQSLAGRTTILELDGLCIDEIRSLNPDITSWELIWMGAFPALHAKSKNVNRYLDSYVQTYVERDVRQLIQLKDLRLFQDFLVLLAGRAGQLLNYSSLSADLGVSSVTVKQWIGVLEASFLVRIVRPWFANVGKRLVKSPKLYFCDTGLLCHLLGIRSAEQLRRDPLRGNIYENFIVSELARQSHNRGERVDFHFFRDEHGNEVDLLIPDGRKWNAIEIKSAGTFHPDFLKGILFFQKMVPELYSSGTLFYDGIQQQMVQGIQVRNLSLPEK